LGLSKPQQSILNQKVSIKVTNITKLYGSQKALDDVSFEVRSGQVVGFLGPNGAGKSTMMKIISCFIPQSEGNVSVCGFDVNEESIEVRKNVGYLPEHNPLYHEMYVKEYLEFICGIHHISDKKKRIEEMIEMTGLQIEQKKKIGSLSKGYRQRVGLAQAMIHEPKVLILDEPTSGLDPNQLTEIRTLIKNIGKEKTVMLSTHIMQEVEAMCSRVIIINKGKIVADENTTILQQKSSKENIVIVEFDKESTKKMLEEITGVKKAELIKGNTWKLKTESDIDVRPLVFNFAVANQIAVLSMQKEEQRLEDVFQSLTVGT
jgi:ABC-2 type transport system ATP-binding protein